MKLAETVTFGGSGLDRRAELRGDAGALADMWAEPDASVILLWRGHPLTAGKTKDRVARISPSHALISACSREALYLGSEESGPVFALDIPDWDGAPDGGEGAFGTADQTQHPAFADDHAFCGLRGVMPVLDPRDAELVVTAMALLNWHASHGFCARCGAVSEISMAGWQRNCTACNGAHFPRTDPVVIMLITHGNDVLIGRSHGWPEGMYSLLAGFVEPGETLEAAVRREVLEESDIKVGPVSYLASQPWPFPNSLMIGCWGEALSRDITIDPEEIDDAIWVSREDIMRSFSGQHPDLVPARKGSIAHFILVNWLADRLN